MLWEERIAKLNPGVIMARSPVFLSCPKPFMKSQEEFLKSVEEELRSHDCEPMTLGRTDYNMDAPLEGIRRLMVGSCGLICLAFRRTHIVSGSDKPNSDLGEDQVDKSNSWITSPYCQIEPAMAFQLGLPILIWREKGVQADGLLDRGALGISVMEFDLNKPMPDLKNDDPWKQPFRMWCSRVSAVYTNRGVPRKLY